MQYTVFSAKKSIKGPIYCSLGPVDDSAVIHLNYILCLFRPLFPPPTLTIFSSVLILFSPAARRVDQDIVKFIQRFCYFTIV